MSKAKIKYNPLVPKKVNVPFKFLGKEYTTGEPFDPAETKASARQMKNLYLVRKLINTTVVAPLQEAKPPKLTQEEQFEKAKQELAEEQAAEAQEVVLVDEEEAVAEEVPAPKPEKKKATSAKKAKAKIEEKAATDDSAKPWEQ